MCDVLIYKQDVQRLVCRLNGCVGTERNFNNCEKRCPDFKAVDELPTVVRTNNDSISRQAAIDFIKDHSYPVRYDRTSIEHGMALTGIEQALNEIPIVQPDQITGQWELTIGYDPKRRFMCDQCARMAYEPSKYCPNCGARMRDGE